MAVDARWAVWMGREVEGSRAGTETVFIAATPKGMDEPALLQLLVGMNPQHVLVGEQYIDRHGAALVVALVERRIRVTAEVRPDQFAAFPPELLQHRGVQGELQFIVTLPGPDLSTLLLAASDTIRVTHRPLHVGWFLVRDMTQLTPDEYADDRLLLVADDDEGHPRPLLLTQ